MLVRLHFEDKEDLHKYFDGKEGEVIEMFEINCLIRVPLDGHTTMHPSTVLLLTEWKTIEVLSG